MGRYNTKSPTEPFLFKVLEVGLRLNPINIQPLKYIKKLDLKGKDCPHVITPKASCPGHAIDVHITESDSNGYTYNLGTQPTRGITHIT